MPTAYQSTLTYDSDVTYWGATSADRPVITVEIDTLSTEFRLVEANEFDVPVYNSANTYNTSFTYEGDSPFRDITQSVLSIQIDRGRSSQTYDHYDAGTAQITLVDYDSRFLPGNPNSIHYPYLTPMRPIRVRAGWSGEDFVLFRGYVDRWDVNWSPNYQAASVTITATDLTKVLNNLDTTVAGLDGESPKTRLDAMLDVHLIPAEFRLIDTGTVTLLQDLTDRRDLWATMQEIETAESGALFIDGAGRIVFKDRINALPTGAGDLFSDSGSDSISYQELRVSSDDELLYNFVSCTISGGTEQTAGDTVSEEEYQRRSLILTELLLETDAQALALAQHLLAVRKVPEVRVESVTIPAYVSTKNQRASCVLDLLSPITVERNAPGGYTFQAALVISGVRHQITPAEWFIEYSTQQQISP